MLVWLGLGVLRRIHRDRLHVHVHRHGSGAPHVHVHAHREAAHEHRRHEHEHGLPMLRSLLVGATHGLAGTAGLVLLAVPAAGSPGWAIAYLGVFALGSIAGMVAFATALAVPMRWARARADRLVLGLEGAIGTAAIVLGCWIVRSAVG